MKKTKWRRKTNRERRFVTRMHTKKKGQPMFQRRGLKWNGECWCAILPFFSHWPEIMINVEDRDRGMIMIDVCKL